MSFLEITNLSAGYPGKTVLDGVSFSAEQGTLTCILGANGSGKTTLLKAVCGILPHRGECILDGQVLRGLPPRKLAKLCSYVGQRSGISIDISLLDVVLMGFNPWLPLLTGPDAAMVRAAREALDRVGLGDRADENYLTLSEGQKQLCILARTLVSSGKLLLLDEPESALDIRHRHQMLDILKNWTRDTRCTLLTLHDPNLALNHCDQLLLLDGGRIAAILHPKTDSFPRMEAALSQIYGTVTLCRCEGSDGSRHIVMVKNREETL